MPKNHTKNRFIDLTSGSVLGKMLRFSLPIMASGVLQLLFNAADIIVVGQFAGDNSMGAVGSTTALINLFTNLFIGLSVGVNVIAARSPRSKFQRRYAGYCSHVGFTVAYLRSGSGSYRSCAVAANAGTYADARRTIVACDNISAYLFPRNARDNAL